MLSITTDEFGWGCTISRGVRASKNTLHTDKKTTPKMIQPAVCCLSDKSRMYDPPGVLRVFIPWLGFDRLLDSAFEQIRMYSKSDVAVSLRILRALGDIAGTTKDPQIHEVLLDRANRIVAGCAERLEEHEMTEVRAARLFAL